MWQLQLAWKLLRIIGCMDSLFGLTFSPFKRGSDYSLFLHMMFTVIYNFLSFRCWASWIHVSKQIAASSYFKTFFLILLFLEIL